MKKNLKMNKLQVMTLQLLKIQVKMLQMLVMTQQLLKIQVKLLQMLVMIRHLLKIQVKLLQMIKKVPTAHLLQLIQLIQKLPLIQKLKVNLKSLQLSIKLKISFLIYSQDLMKLDFHVVLNVKKMINLVQITVMLKRAVYL